MPATPAVLWQHSHANKNAFAARLHNIINPNITDCSYIQYSNIAARILRESLKTGLRADAAKRDASHVKFTPWANGKPARTYHNTLDGEIAAII